MKNLRARLFRVIVGIDQALNPLVYGGSEDVTLSAQSAYNELVLGTDTRKRKFIDFLFAKLCGEKNHCYWSLYVELDEFSDAESLKALLAEHGVSA